jgi:hypothetical protein
MDDIFSLDIIYANEDVDEELYRLVRDGLCSQLDVRLQDLTNPIKYLTALSWHGEEHVSLLMVAALNGCDDIVRVLLTHCDPEHQVELTGQIVPIEDGDRICCVTALYCACYRGHFTVAKTLIEVGRANVNHSCLSAMNFLYRTPVLCAALADHIEFMRLLHEAGADFSIESNFGVTPMRIAVNHKRNSTIQFLLEESINTIEDLELAVCDLINDVSSSNEQMNTVFELLKLALQRRELLDIPKVCIQSLDIYDYKEECRTVDELNDIKDDQRRIFIEILLIRERLYSSRPDIKLLEPLENYGDKLMAEEEFIKCLNVYLHVFYLHQKMNIGTNLYRFVWFFCKMLTANQRIPIDRFIQVCCLAFEPSQSKHINMRINNALFLVIIATKVI